METGVPNEGHFAKKQDRSPPLWSFARTGFILAVCTPLAIAPVPATAEDYYTPPHPSGGIGVGTGLAIGLGAVGLGLLLHHLTNNPPGYAIPTGRRRHPTSGFIPPRVYGPGPEHSPRHPQRYVPPPVEPVRYSKPPKNEPAPPPPTKPPRVARAPAPPPPRPNSGVPPKDEHRYVPDEVLFELRAGVSPQTIDAIARRQRVQLQRLASQPLELIGTTLYRYKITDKRSVPTVVAALERDAGIATVQPNYLYTLQGQNGPLAGNQYAGPKMHLPEAHTISNGGKTLVAVIDSGIDSTHPEFSGAITESFDAIDGGNGGKAILGNAADGMVHGTEVAGIIASHAALTGVAPQAHILAVRAFAKGGGRTAVAGTTYDILAGTEWAVKRKAQVVNMSFVGPPDPDLSRELAEGSRRRVIFIAAVGNEGKAAKPSYPAAYESVIPVTATDRADAIFKDASRCSTTCVAAPGVDIFAAAPAGAYKYDSGTSMAAAQVSGVVALLLDAKPDLDPRTVRDLLVKTAKHLSPADPDESTIAGIVDAYAMLEAAAAPGPPEGSVSTAPAEPPEGVAENAPPAIAGRSVAAPDSASRPAAKGAELPRNPPPVDQNPTGSLKADAQPDSPPASKSLPTATDAELARKEEVLW